MSGLAERQTDSSKTVTLNDTTTILMSRTPLVATGDITGATASQTEDQWVLNFTVTDDAAKRVHEFTKQHVGKNMATVVDGKVHGTPRIAAATHLANPRRVVRALERGSHPVLPKLHVPVDVLAPPCVQRAEPAACDLAHDPNRVAITRLTARTIAGAPEEVKGLRGANGALKREVIDYNVGILTRPGGK